MQPDDIMSYAQIVVEEKVNLQKGMNFRLEKSDRIISALL